MSNPYEKSKGDEKALMEGTEDTAISFDGEEEDQSSTRKPMRHPFAVFFHLVFRIMAILVYLFCSLLTSSFITSFVSILLLLSMDFWTVKNVTGRLLVGLRWWNYVDDNGESHWVYECKKDGDKVIDSAESGVFWLSLVGAPALWSLFLFVSLIGFNLQWLVITLIALVFNGANLYGYIRCRLGKKKSISSAASNFFSQQLLRGMFSGRNAQVHPTANQQS